MKSSLVSKIKKLALVPIVALTISSNKANSQELQKFYSDSPSKQYVLEDKVKSVLDFDINVIIGINKYIGNNELYSGWEKNFSSYNYMDISNFNISRGDVLDMGLSYKFKLDNILVGPRIAINSSNLDDKYRQISMSYISQINNAIYIEDIICKTSPSIGVSVDVVKKTKISSITLELFQCTLKDRHYKGEYDSNNLIDSHILETEPLKKSLGGRIYIGLHSPFRANYYSHGSYHFYDGDYRDDYRKGQIKPVDFGVGFYVEKCNHNIGGGMTLFFQIQYKNFGHS